MSDDDTTNGEYEGYYARVLYQGDKGPTTVPASYIKHFGKLIKTDKVSWKFTLKQIWWEPDKGDKKNCAKWRVGNVLDVAGVYRGFLLFFFFGLVLFREHDN